jgi:hypothetical protein
VSVSGWQPIVDNAREAVLRDENPAWASSPYAAIRGAPTRATGRLGERIVELWADVVGVPWTNGRSNLGADCYLDGVATEVKLATESESGALQFNKIEAPGVVRLCALMWIRPREAGLWIVTQEDAWAAGTTQRDARRLFVTKSTKWSWLHSRDASPRGASVQLSDALARLS